jgi:hypothetical protein
LGVGVKVANKKSFALGNGPVEQNIVLKRQIYVEGKFGFSQAAAARIKEWLKSSWQDATPVYSTTIALNEFSA